MPLERTTEGLPLPSSRLVRWLVVVAVVMFTGLAVWLIIWARTSAHDAATTDARVRNLSRALAAQRIQFLNCKDQGPNVAGCRTPVAPAPGDVGPPGPAGAVGAIGPIGPEGTRGRQGPQGPQGPQGVDGKPGVAGSPGTPGAAGRQGIAGPPGAPGDTGPPGEPGQAGQAGPPGEAGPKGEQGPPGDPGKPGEQGPKGEPGVAGQAGPAGYPDSFSFAGPGGAQYTCTDPDGDHNYTCAIAAIGQPQQSGPVAPQSRAPAHRAHDGQRPRLSSANNPRRSPTGRTHPEKPSSQR